MLGEGKSVFFRSVVPERLPVDSPIPVHIQATLIGLSRFEGRKGKGKEGKRERQRI